MAIYINGGVGTTDVDITLRSSTQITDSDSPYAAPTAADIIETDTTLGVIVITFAGMATDKVIVVSDIAGTCGTNAVTITPTAGTIDGAASLVLNTNWNSVTLKHLGSNAWKII